MEFLKTKSEQVIELKPFEMTHEQVGIILALSSEISSTFYDKEGLPFIQKWQTKERAEEFINELKGMIDKEQKMEDEINGFDNNEIHMTEEEAESIVMMSQVRMLSDEDREKLPMAILYLQKRENV